MRQPCQCPRIVSIVFSIALGDQLHLLRVRHDYFVSQLREQPADPRGMCPSLQGHETSRYLPKGLFHRFRCRGHFLFQNDFPRFIQNAIARPVIAEVQTNRELVSFENHVSIYPNSASLFHSRSPFLLRLERVIHWERIASRGETGLLISSGKFVQIRI